jgi:membrane protein
MLITNNHDGVDRHTAARTEQKGQYTPTMPSHIPLYGWRSMLWRSGWRMFEDRLFGEAAAVAFYSLLAVLPALAALASLLSLSADPQVVADRLRTLAAPLPAGAAEMASDIFGQVLTGIRGRLDLGLGLAATALWSAMAAASQLFGALNVIYREPERRGFAQFTLVTLLFACGAALFIILALGGIVATPAVVSFWTGPDTSMGKLLRLLRWPVLLIAVSTALAVTYRFGPSRACPQWRWVSWGGTIAGMMWLIGSAAVS